MSLESSEFWKNAFEIAGVFLLLLTFLAGAGVLWFSRRVNTIQGAQLRQFDQDLTSAKSDLGKQQERAANADARVAGLEKDASDAKAAQEKIETELNIQKARAASAEADLIRLKESQKWRTIGQAERAKLVKILKSVDKGTISIEYPADDPEAFQFAREVHAIFSDAEWPPIKGNEPQGMIADTNLGLGVIVHRRDTAPRYAGAIQKAFKSAGIQMWGLASEKRAENEVVVSVGHKQR